MLWRGNAFDDFKYYLMGPFCYFFYLKMNVDFDGDYCVVVAAIDALFFNNDYDDDDDDAKTQLIVFVALDCDRVVQISSD